MPGRKVKSGLAQKLGTRLDRAHESHKSDEIRSSGGAELPAGIEMGIAQVKLCKIDQYKPEARWAGEYYFMAQAIVVEPKVFDGIPIEGLRTRIGPEPIADLPEGSRNRNTVDQQIDWIYNELRKLGVNTSEMESEDLEPVVTAIEEGQPYIRFRTWSGAKQELVKKDGKLYVMRGSTQQGGPYKTEEAAKRTFPYLGREPIVNHNWNGLVEYTPDEKSDIEDNTEEADEEPWVADEAKEEQLDEDMLQLGEEADNGDPKAMTKLQGQAKLFNIDSDELATWVEVAQAIVEASETDEARDESGAEEEISVQDLGDMADEGDEDAQTKLTEIAEQYSVEDEYESWAEWAEAIVEARKGSSNGFVPKTGEIYSYKPKGKRKATKHSVMAVFEKKETCNLKNTDTGEVSRGIAWSELQQ